MYTYFLACEKYTSLRGINNALIILFVEHHMQNPELLSYHSGI